ncbi:MAG: phage minor head protein [Rhodopila sp.]|nr:phage minor head protein [Rhodopila sp.]
MPARQLTAPTRKPVALAPVRPNLGVEFAYQRELDKLVDRMNEHVQAVVLGVYGMNPPKLAADESSPSALRAAISRLAREWSGRFDAFAKTVGRRFSVGAIGSADRSFAASLREAGFTVQFKMTPAASEIMQATIAEQVNLIKSIPAEYLTAVQGSVMRSVTTGRDLGGLSNDLQQQFGVTKRRAATIARDQNAKATASITRARQQELGIVEAIWLHSAGGKTPRPTHVGNNGKRYTISEGWFDPAAGKRIWPGQEVNCRCVSKSVIPGLD